MVPSFLSVGSHETRTLAAAAAAAAAATTTAAASAAPSLTRLHSLGSEGESY